MQIYHQTLIFFSKKYLFTKNIIYFLKTQNFKIKILNQTYLVKKDRFI